MKGGWHRFRAPIDGVAYEFSMRCDGSEPKRLYCVDPRQCEMEAVRALHEHLTLINALLNKGVPWDAICQQRSGDIGAVIESAEMRRSELYDRQVAS